MKILEKHSLIWHLAAWLLIVLLLGLILSVADGRLNALFLTKIGSFCLLVGLFYLNLLVLMPRVLKKKLSWWIYILFLLLSLIVILRVEILAFNRIVLSNEFVEHNPHFGNKPPVFLPIPFALMSILLFLLTVGISSFMVMRKERQKEKELKQQIEFEKIAAELAVLKLQISPHFLFNTLNNIRWLARKKSDKTEEAIIQLSQLLRYIIYQANATKVPLEQEITHLKNFIDLQKMRMTEPEKVKLYTEGELKNHQIEPLLFIPFLENAFKYGVNSQAQADIIFRIQTTPSSLIFETENTIFEENLPQTTGESGIGIANVQKRLALFYPNRHELILKTRVSESNKTSQVFKVFLRIDF